MKTRFWFLQNLWLLLRLDLIKNTNCKWFEKMHIHSKTTSEVRKSWIFIDIDILRKHGGKFLALSMFSCQWKIKISSLFSYIDVTSPTPFFSWHIADYNFHRCYIKKVDERLSTYSIQEQFFSFHSTLSLSFCWLPTTSNISFLTSLLIYF